MCATLIAHWSKVQGTVLNLLWMIMMMILSLLITMVLKLNGLIAAASDVHVLYLPNELRRRNC